MHTCCKLNNSACKRTERTCKPKLTYFLQYIKAKCCFLPIAITLIRGVAVIPSVGYSILRFGLHFKHLQRYCPKIIRLNIEIHNTIRLNKFYLIQDNIIKYVICPTLNIKLVFSICFFLSPLSFHPGFLSYGLPMQSIREGVWCMHAFTQRKKTKYW